MSLSFTIISISFLLSLFMLILVSKLGVIQVTCLLPTPHIWQERVRANLYNKHNIQILSFKKIMGAITHQLAVRLIPSEEKVLLIDMYRLRKFNIWVQTQHPLCHIAVWDQDTYSYQTQTCREGRRDEGMEKADWY